MKTISSELLLFLSDLKENNNRDWFNERKPTFKMHEKMAKEFFAEVQEKLRVHDDIESHKLMRIYRDVRFSKDKTPFKARLAGSFKRATERLRGGYYLNLEPDNCMVGGGFYGPNPQDLMRIRKEFEIDDSEIREIINNPDFKKTFGTLEGDGVKTAPKGFSKDHKAIDLIKKKQYYAMKRFTNEEMMAPDFADKVVETFKVLRPYFDYMSEVLTTNLNGESILTEA